MYILGNLPSCILGTSLHISIKDMYTLPSAHPCILKMCTIGIYLHIYLVSSGCFPAHLYKRCVHWASTQTSFLNICTLGIYPCTTILKICILGISLHICIKDVYIGHLPTHIS